MPVLPFVITISRQLGSGGAFVGQHLADRMGILYVDREILSQAAQQLKVLEEELVPRDEKKSSFWESFFRACAINSPEVYIPPEIKILNDQELYQVESAIVQRIAQERPAVIIGRGGSYVLRQHPRHLSVFLHADLAFRRQRIQTLYNLSEPDAKKLVEKSDLERNRYFHLLTGGDWFDARQYHLAIDTGVIGFDRTEAIIMDYISDRFGKLGD